MKLTQGDRSLQLQHPGRGSSGYGGDRRQGGGAWAIGVQQ
jgi:hypothetical protein